MTYRVVELVLPPGAPFWEATVKRVLATGMSLDDAKLIQLSYINRHEDVWYQEEK